MTTKDLVFEYIKYTKGNVDLENLTKLVLHNKPESKWDQSHWDYYRSGIVSPNGRYTHLFSEEIKGNLRNLTVRKVERKRNSILEQEENTILVSAWQKHTWPIWDIPNDEEQLILAKALLPYIKILNPKIVERIVADNNRNYARWSQQFEQLGIRPDIYLWENSPVTFPGIRRHVGTVETSTFRNNPKLSKAENAIYLDDNSYPKEIWSFALRNIRYGKKNPDNYSLAHILDHKDFNTRNTNELNGFQQSESKNSFAGLYTSCTNVVYIPTTFLKPTDHNSRIRQLLIQIVDKYYGAVCIPLPHSLSFNLQDIEEKWHLENFPQPAIVGNHEFIDNFIRYRNDVINNRIKELSAVI